jgi:hypothetical protein
VSTPTRAHSLVGSRAFVCSPLSCGSPCARAVSPPRHPVAHERAAAPAPAARACACLCCRATSSSRRGALFPLRTRPFISASDPRVLAPISPSLALSRRRNAKPPRSSGAAPEGAPSSCQQVRLVARECFFGRAVFAEAPFWPSRTARTHLLPAGLAWADPEVRGGPSLALSSGRGTLPTHGFAGESLGELPGVSRMFAFSPHFSPCAHLCFLLPSPPALPRCQYATRPRSSDIPPEGKPSSYQRCVLGGVRLLFGARGARRGSVCTLPAPRPHAHTPVPAGLV